MLLQIEHSLVLADFVAGAKALTGRGDQQILAPVRYHRCFRCKLNICAAISGNTEIRKTDAQMLCPRNQPLGWPDPEIGRRPDRHPDGNQGD
jgi:hypothetical protein